MYNQQLLQPNPQARRIHAIRSFLRESREPICLILILILLVLLSTFSSNSVIRAESIVSTEREVKEAPSLMSIVIELDDAPVIQTYTKLRSLERNGRRLDATEIALATQAQLARVESAQQRVTTSLATLDAQIIYQTQRVYNGIGVRIHPGQLSQLMQIDGIKAIHPLVPKSPLNDTSVPYIGASALWSGVSASNVGNISGEDVTIAIIDTGIDYTHSDFGGSGKVDDFNLNDPSIIGDIAGYPSAKIIGGYDFSGDSYNADPDDADYQPIPHPDADPMDCYSHGTHVAGTAGGYGVNSDGTTYMGNYSRSIDFNSLKIGPGAAPKAKLYALKIFGCTGGSELTDLAIEWAVDPNGDGDFSDHVDVINMSLGSTYGSPYDSTSIASDNAAKAGVIVVGSAGNSGDNYYIIGSPSVSSHTISVAAIQHPEPSSQANSTIPFYDRVATFTSRGPRRNDAFLKPDIAAPGRLIHSARQGSGYEGRELSGTSMAAPHVAGAMALLRQHYPDWSVDALKALVMNTANHNIPYSTTEATGTPVTYSPTRIGAGRIDLENALRTHIIAYNADDPGLVSVSFGAPEVVTSMSATKNILVENKGNLATTYALSYVSVVDAPGVVFTSPNLPEISGLITVPVAGIVTFAIEMSADPTQMRHTRDETVSEAISIPRHWVSEEAGYLLLTPQNQPDGTPTNLPTLTIPLYAAPRPASEMQATISEINFGEESYVKQEIILTGEAIQQHGTVPDPSALAIRSLVSAFELHLISPNDPIVEDNISRAYTDRETSILRDTHEDINPMGADPSVIVDSRTDVRLPTTTTPTEEFNHADLMYVGVTSDLARTTSMFNPTGLVAQSNLYFAIATHQDWTSPNEVRFDIFIDIDRDGESDYRLFNADAVGYNNKFVATDTFVSVLEDLKTGILSPQQPLNSVHPDAQNTSLFHTNVLFLAVQAEKIGLDADTADVENTGIDFYVESYSYDNEYRVDDYIEKTPVMTYNIAKAGLELFVDNPDAPLNRDVDGGSIQFNFTLENYALSTAKGLLLFHHHNIRGKRAEIVPIQYLLPEQIYLPLISR